MRSFALPYLWPNAKKVFFVDSSELFVAALQYLEF